MNNKNNLVRLSEYKEEEIMCLISHGIKGETELFVMNSKTNNFQKLKQGEIEDISSNHPNKAEIFLTPATYTNIGHLRQWETPSHSQHINFKSLWANKKLVDELLKANPKTPVEEEKKEESGNPAPPYMDESHPNFAPELKASVMAWMHLYSDPNSQPGSVESLLQKFLDDNKIQYPASNSNTGNPSKAISRISSVITPKFMKTKKGSLASIIFPSSTKDNP